MPQSIDVAARDSPLSRRQVEEVYEEMRLHYPDLIFHSTYLKTSGDCDRSTSLRSLEKTDFFTREIDALVLKGECRVAIHSAKDLPKFLVRGLEVIALTKGIDPSDSLVLRQGENLYEGAIVATSSVRREEMVKQIAPEVQIIDIRGNIGERLEKLEKGEVDGVVVAEAALIRLGLTHLNRIRLPGETVPLQGHLAIVARKGDHEMRQLFNPVAWAAL